MFSNQLLELSLNAPTKCLAAIRADKTDSRFIAGSCSLHETNQITVFRFHPELNDLGIDGRLDHSVGPVGVLCPSPSEKSMLLTVAEESCTATLWRIPAEVIDRTDELDYNPDSVDSPPEEDTQEYSLEQISTLVDFDADSPILNMVWRDTNLDVDRGDTGVAGEVISLDRSGRVTMWDVEAAQPVQTHNVTFENQMTPPRIALDPHGAHGVAVTVGDAVRVVDWRADSYKASATIEGFRAHRFGVADIDYNPNKPFVLATAGLDGLLKFWDLRNPRIPLLTARGGHAHYTWNVKYNPFHDQLVLSTGTDSTVNLWRISSISSAPLLAEVDDASETSAPNLRVARYEHADSVYGMAWGAADAWLYASVGYDGKVLANHVPSKEKYKILL